MLLAVLFAWTWTKSRQAVSSKYVTIWVVTPDSTGLQQDAHIFERFLGSHTALSQAPPPSTLLTPNDDKDRNKCIYLYLEVSPTSSSFNAHPGWNDVQSKCRIAIMINTDQFTRDVFDTPNLELLLCKTRQCVKWLDQEQERYLQEKPQQQRVPIVFTGFASDVPAVSSSSSSTTSHDDDDDDETSLARFDKFLHVAGKSPHKGTLSILQAWIQHLEWPTLTLTSFNNPAADMILSTLQQQNRSLPSNIQHLNYKLPKTELAAIMHSHGVHMCLSGMEGFGHYINEGRAVGALVVTTDYPAMNEMIRNETIGILVEPMKMLTWPMNGLPYAHVDANAIADTMTVKVLPKSLQERADIGARARRAFHEDQRKFAKRAKQLDCFFQNCRGVRVDGAVEESRACAEESCGLQVE